MLVGRRRADRAERGLDVLLRDGRDDLLGVHALRREPLRVEPDAHRELRPVDRRLADAADTQQHRLDVRIGVVGNLQARHRPLRRAKREEAEEVRRLRADAAAELARFRRQLRLGLRQTVLHLHEVHVAVGLDLEGDAQLVLAVVRRVRRHVDHVIHAVDLVLQRRRDRVQHLAGVRARIGIRDGDLRRRELRILRDGELPDRHHARHREDEGDDHREARPLDEDARERLDLVNARSDSEFHSEKVEGFGCLDVWGLRVGWLGLVGLDVKFE